MNSVEYLAVYGRLMSLAPSVPIGILSSFLVLQETIKNKYAMNLKVYFFIDLTCFG